MITVMFWVVGLPVAWVLTGGVRRYALARSVLDVPNARSSHSVPTPRGGGLAIALTSLGGVALTWAIGMLEQPVALALLGGGAAVALVGWIDDHRGVRAWVRAAVHLAAASWAVWMLDGFGELRLGAGTLAVGQLGAVLAVLGIAWCINLYNFMDGIDGIAGAEAVFVGVVGGGIMLTAGSRGLASVAFVIAAASAGFLMWNWAPAKIFMGDVGSGLLGFLFGTIAFASAARSQVPLLAWGLLLGVFLFDASVTLVRRVIRGEKWYSAHQSHAYQRAVQVARSHRKVSVSVLAINLLLAALTLVGWSMPQMLLPAAGAGLALLTGVYAFVERVRPMS